MIKISKSPLLKIAVAFCFACLIFFSLKYAVYAHLGGDPVEVQVSGSSTEDELITVNETIQNGRYTVIMNGVPSSSKAELLSSIEENIEHIQTEVPVKFVNQGFVDADKYSYTYSPEDSTKQYDYGQCWLASTSDMLTISGWAQGLYNPLNNYEGNSEFLTPSFEDEDDVFLYLTSNFEHYANFQENGLSFFFDGLYRRYSFNGTTLTKEKTALKNSVGTEQQGFYKDIYVKNLIEKINFTGSTENLTALDNFEKKTYGVQLDFDGNGGHAVTAVGVIIDNTKTGIDKYVAIFIADSDNEDAADIDVAPESMKAAYEARKSRVNSYTMYGIEVTKNSNGAEAVRVKGYNSNQGENTFLGSVVTLPFKDSADTSSAIETASNATKDAKNNADFIADFVTISKVDDYSSNSIHEGDDIQIDYSIVNASDISSLTTENSGADVIKNKIEILKDGAVYKEIVDPLDIKTSNPDSFNQWIGFRGSLNLKELGISLPAGNYTLKLYVNTDNAKESYVLNNTPAEYSFTVLPAQKNSKVTVPETGSTANANYFLFTSIFLGICLIINLIFLLRCGKFFKGVIKYVLYFLRFKTFG